MPPDGGASVEAGTRLVVGSWPGRSFGWNSFIATFCDALEAAGCEVVDVDDPRHVARRLDVLHVHWPEEIFWRGGGRVRLCARTVAMLGALARLKRDGTRIVWMVHNLRPHDLGGVRRPLWAVLGRRMARLADGFMTLSPATVAVVRDVVPGLARMPAASAWHPAYPGARPAPDRAACRARAGLPPDAHILAFLGLIRPYKGVEELIAAFRADPDPGRRLLIAGHSDKAGYGEGLARLAGDDPRIGVRLGRLDDRAFAGLTAAADAIVLPFRDYLHSGSMIHALSHARPVITPAAPFADALARQVGEDWVRTYRGALSPAALARGREWPTGAPDLSCLDAARLGVTARDFYRELVKGECGR